MRNFHASSHKSTVVGTDCIIEHRPLISYDLYLYNSALLRPVLFGLQQENADVVQALDDIDDVIAVLSRWRDEAEQEYGLLFGEKQNVACFLGISIEKPRTTVRSRYRSNATSALASGDRDNA